MKLKITIILFLLFIIEFKVKSQSINDYGTIATGNYTDVTIWRQWDGVGWNNFPASYPNSSFQNVYIRNGHTVTLPSPGPYNVKSLIVESGGKILSNLSSTNVYLNIWGKNIICDGEIGNNVNFDGISFNVESDTTTINGGGLFTCSRIRKNSSTINSSTILIFNMNVDVNWNTVSTTAIYNNANNSNFKIIINPNCTVNVGNSINPSNLSIDGIDGLGAGTFSVEAGGTITVRGTLVVYGIIHATTNNSNTLYGINFIIENGGVLKANEIRSPISGLALMFFTVQSGGKLELMGPNGFNISGGATTWNIGNNRYYFNAGSTVEYSALSNQNVLHPFEFNTSNVNGSTNLNHRYWNLIVSGSGNKILRSYTTNATPFIVRGNITIAGNAILDQSTNNPDLQIGGNWTNYNQSGFLESNNNLKSVFFNGSGTFPNTAQQTIFCSGGEIFNNMNIQKLNNASVKLLSNVTVKNTLQLGFSNTFGILELNSNSLNILNYNTNAIKLLGLNSNVNNFRYIISEDTINRNTSIVNWKIDTAVGTYLIPFGISNTKDTIPFFLKKTTNNDIGTLTVSTYGTPPSNLPYPSNPINVTNLFGLNNPFPDNRDYTVDRFWYIGSTNQLNCDTVILTYNNKVNSISELPIADPNIQNMKAQFWNTSANSWQFPFQYGVNSQSPYPANSVTIDNFNFNNTFWTLSSLSSPLPVELINFEAKKEGDKIKILWSTSSEKENDYFVIYKSYDGINFVELATIDGSNNSNNINNYYIYDYEQLERNIYYKLRQVDNNGVYKDYPIIYFKNNLESNKIIKILNSIGQEVNIDYKGIKFLFYENGKIKKTYE